MKLLDFGIARYHRRGRETQAERRIGIRGLAFITPRLRQSPEQIRGEPLTTASDVYQLGLLLYRLLTGRAPYVMDEKRPDSLQRAICEDAPTRPSVAVGREGPANTTGGDATSPEDVGAARRSTPAALRRTLSGDLDNILLMALRKEPERRYFSVDQLVEDIHRYLEGLPVIARPDTLSYRTSKFVGRHRVAVALGATALLLLVVFAASMAVLARRLADERDRANREAATAEQVSEFLVELFEVADPGEARGNTVTAREILDRGAKRVNDELASQPAVRAALMDTIGRVYQNLGLYDDAAPLIEQALDLRRTALGDDHLDVARSLNNLAWLLETRGEYDAAEPRYREALERHRRLLGSKHDSVAGSLNNLGLLLFRKGDYEEAGIRLNEALVMRRELLGDEHVEVADTLSNLGLLAYTTGEYTLAEERFGQALAMRRKLREGDHPDVAISLDNLGRAKFAQKQYDDAQKLFAEALEMRRKLFGDEHPDTAQSLNNVASLLVMLEDYEAAEPLFREVVALDRKLLGETHPDYGVSVNNLANLLQRQGKFAEALPLYVEAQGVLEQSFDSTHYLVGMAKGGRGGCLLEMKRYAEAEPWVLAGFETMQAALGDDHRRTRSSARRIVDLYEEWGKPSKADPYRPLATTEAPPDNP